MRTSIIPSFVAVGILGFGLLSSTQAQPPTTQPIDGIRNIGPQITALTKAKIVTRSGKVIEKGTILIRDGKIIEIGENIPIVGGYKVVDLSEKTIYPGWIDSYTEVEVASESTKGTHYWNTNVQPERAVSPAYQPNAEQLTKFRKAGIGAVLAVPSGGIIRGTSSVVSTGTKSVDKSIVAPTALGHVRLTTGFRIGGGGGYPTSPMGAVALARQAFLDADWYGRAWQAYRAQPSLPQPESNEALDALVDWTKTGRSVMFDTLNEQYAMRADKFAREFGLPMILHGSGREYRLLDKIVSMNRPMVIPVNFPKAPNVSTSELANGAPLQDLMHWELAPENPARLVAAGAKVAITSEGLDNPEELRAQIRTAIQRGLSPDAALDAVTIVPAEMLGVESVLGSIAVGKWANFIVCSGDLWDEKSKIDETWVQGDRFRWSEEKPIDVSGSWNMELQGSEGKPTTLTLKLEGDKKLKGSLSLPKPPEPVAENKANEPEKPKPPVEEPPSPSDASKANVPQPDANKTAEANKAADPKPTDANPPSDAPKTDASKGEGDKSGRGERGVKKKEEGVAELESLQWVDTRLTALFDVQSLKAGEGKGQLTLVLLAEPSKKGILRGTILWADGSVSVLSGKPIEKTDKESSEKVESEKAASKEKGDEKKDDKKEDSKEGKDDKKGKVDKAELLKTTYSKVNMPFGEFGVQAPASKPEWVLVKNATIWTSGPQGNLERTDILIHDGVISQLGKEIAAPEGAIVIDGTGKHVSPGIIDCHSHMATDGGVNEAGQAVTAEVRIGDFIDANDYTIYCQLGGGVTTANILHGSANPIGGQNQVIKLRWGLTSDELKMKEAPAGIKFALGENVKQSNRAEPGDRYPQSRMGVEQIMRDRFEAAKEYDKQWKAWTKEARGLPPRRDLELEAISEILKGERWVHCHSYRQDEILAMLRVLEDYKVTIGSLQHILEGYKVAEAMAKHGATGSTFSDWWGYKFEVVDAIPFNGALMHKMGVVVSFNSDDNELARHLNHEAAKAVKYGGLSPEEALKFVTLNPAKQLRIDSYVGSLEVGKQADFVIWSGSPLSPMSRCEQTWIDGRKYFDRESDLKIRHEVNELHQKLVQKVLAVEAPMGEPGQRSLDASSLWPRFDEFCHHHHGDDHDDHEENDHSNAEQE